MAVQGVHASGAPAGDKGVISCQNLFNQFEGLRRDLFNGVPIHPLDRDLSRYPLHKRVRADIELETLMSGLKKYFRTDLGLLRASFNLSNPLVDPNDILRKQSIVAEIANNDELYNAIDRDFQKIAQVLGSSNRYFELLGSNSQDYSRINGGLRFTLSSLRVLLKNIPLFASIFFWNIPNAPVHVPLAFSAMFLGGQHMILSLVNSELSSLFELAKMTGSLLPTVHHLFELMREVSSLRILAEDIGGSSEDPVSARSFQGAMSFTGHGARVLNDPSPSIFDVFRMKNEWRNYMAYVSSRYQYQALMMMSAIAELEYAFVMAKLVRDFKAKLPEINEDLSTIIYRDENARYPYYVLTGQTAIPTSLAFDADQRIALLTGINGGGKTVLMLTRVHNMLLAQNGGPVFAERAIVTPSRIETAIKDHSETAENISRGQSQAKDAGRITEAALSSPAPIFVATDELFSGTRAQGQVFIHEGLLEILVEHPAAYGIGATHLTEMVQFLMESERLPGLFAIRMAENPEEPPFTFLPGIAKGHSYGEVIKDFGSEELARRAGKAEERIDVKLTVKEK